MTRIHSYLLALAASASLVVASSSNTMCYFPDGTPSPTDFVCNSTTGDGFSSCCGHQQDGSQAFCLSNGLCLSDMLLSRGSCTDKSWKSGNCAQVCTKQNPGGGLGVRPCGYSGKWDCGDGSSCKQDAIDIPTGTFEFTTMQFSNFSAARSQNGHTPSTTSGVLTSMPVDTVTVTPMPVSKGASAGTVGAAVGVPLGVLALVFLGLWLFERRKSIQMRKQLASAGAPSVANPPAPPTVQVPAAAPATAPVPAPIQAPPPTSVPAPLPTPAPSMSAYSNSASTAYYGISGGGRGGIQRMPSQYSVMVSPTSTQPPPLRTQSVHFDQNIFQHQSQQSPYGAQISRMPSSASAFPNHPAYQQQQQQQQQEYRGSMYSPSDAGPPAPPPKIYGLPHNQIFLAEAPSDNFRGRPRNMSQVQELPAEM